MYTKMKIEENEFIVLKHKNNVLDRSSVNNVYGNIISSGISIRYVIDGVEHYRLNNRRYSIRDGHYLLSNHFQTGTVEIQEKKNVEGLCAELSTDLIVEIIASMKRPDTSIPDASIGAYFFTDLLIENEYCSQSTNLGRWLKQQSFQWMDLEKLDEINLTEMFYSMAERLVHDQIPIIKEVSSIQALKSETKKELYRRIKRSLEYMDTHFLDSLTINQLAKEALLSEYHFYRVFKSVQEISPYQYILHKRLDYAYHLLALGEPSVSLAAIQSGFSDIYSFSKAFKKRFQLCPSEVLKSISRK